RGDPGRDAPGLGATEPEGWRAERDGAGGRGAGEAAVQALPVEAGGRPDRARSAVDLPVCQAEPAAAVPGDLRRAGLDDELPSARVEHPRAPGARTTQRRPGQRVG